MIKKILKNSSCAECRMCCIFDRYDIWETPIFDSDTMNAVLKLFPDAKFHKKGNGFILDAGEISGEDIFSCPALTENGCILGDNKPFDCRIWPFRIMRKDGRRVIAVSSLCENVYGQSHESLIDFLNEGLAEKIFAYADEFPEAVHEFYDNYAVLLSENDMKAGES